MDRRTFIGMLIGTGLASKVFGVAERPHDDIIYSEGWGGNHELLWGEGPRVIIHNDGELTHVWLNEKHISYPTRS